MQSNVYLDLTRELNLGRLRAVISSGQAVVLHRLAMMSKDGDWILREDAEALAHALAVLARHGARYRFGAPLERAWMAGGWSAHLEFRQGDLRVRTDFVTRPPRLSAERLAALWRDAQGREPPFVGARDLADLKKTNRERDYAVIGELARLMEGVDERLLYSRSARDLIELARLHPERAAELEGERPLLGAVTDGREELERALDAERRSLMRANEERLLAYLSAAEAWRAAWPDLERECARLPLARAHELVVRRARILLPFSPEAGAPHG